MTGDSMTMLCLIVRLRTAAYITALQAAGHSLSSLCYHLLRDVRCNTSCTATRFTSPALSCTFCRSITPQIRHKISSVCHRLSCSFVSRPEEEQDAEGCEWSDRKWKEISWRGTWQILFGWSNDGGWGDAVCVAYGEKVNSCISFVEEDSLVRPRSRWHDTTKRVLNK